MQVTQAGFGTGWGLGGMNQPPTLPQVAAKKWRETEKNAAVQMTHIIFPEQVKVRENY